MNTARYLICPTGGDVPFLIRTLEEAINFTSTEEYYAVDLTTLEVISGEGYTAPLITEELGDGDGLEDEAGEEV